MIPFDFIYCRPDTLDEAVQCFTQLRSEGREPVYYAGGSEIISMCRAGSLRPGAVIDLKAIPDCRGLGADNQALRMGACCTLNELEESNRFPLLRLVCGRIADHTNRCRITLGGNLCGTILYRETSLPLLLSDAEVTLHGPEGTRTVPFVDIFDGRMRLEPGEFLVKLHVPLWSLGARYFHVKRTRNEKIDYPLLSVAALQRDGNLRVAFSGLCARPFRSAALEGVLNDRGRSPAARAGDAAMFLPEPPMSDVEGSGEYRLFVLRNTLLALLEGVENGEI